MKREKISECPNELQELIELVNLLPKDWENFEQDSRRLVEQWQTEIYKPISEEENALSNLLSKYGKKFRQLITPELAERMNRKPEKMDLLNAQIELSNLNNQNLALRNIINLFQQFKEYNNPNQSFELNKHIQTISFNPDTTLELSGFRVIEILTRNKISIERIRICPICRNIFWAKRIEAPTCSKKKCSNNFHQRKLRIKEYEERLNKELKKLENFKSNLSPENSLITQQEEKATKLQQKINREKKKNATL